MSITRNALINQIVQSGEDCFVLIADNQKVKVGTKAQIIRTAELLGFTDLEFAFRSMEENLHTLAEFGINRTFIFSRDIYEGSDLCH